MNQKQSVLIVESQNDWLQHLSQSMPDGQFDIQVARTYDEAMQSLTEMAFDLALIDPVLEGAALSDRMEQNDPGGLMLLTKMTLNYPQMRVIVVSGSMGREMLRNAPELPADLPIIQKQNWDTGTFQ